MPRPTARLIQAAAFAIVLLAPCLAAAERETYALDPVHTRVVFEVSHAGFSQAIGTVSGTTGSLRFDPADWTSACLRAEVPLERLELGDARWNRAALAANLLDAGAHPMAVFTSTRVEPVDDTRARVHGVLQLRGVSREVVLEVQLNRSGRHPLPPFRRTVGFSATTEVSRADFGMDAWKTVIGDRVGIRIEAEATRSRDDAAPPALAPAADAGDDTAPPPLPDPARC